MQAADDVELGDGLGPALAGAMPDLFERPGVGLGILRPLAERAQLATGDADIGGIDVPVHIEPGHIAMLSLANQVGHVADGQNIGGAIKGQPVLDNPGALRPLPFPESAANAGLRLDLHLAYALRPRK